MTAEIALLNRTAVALAADSAITIGNKVYNSSNKLFMLSKYHPVGIMIYSKADFMDYPWEVIIKLFRKNLSKTKFKTLEEYSNNFLESLEKNSIFTNQVQEKFFESTIFDYFKNILEDINSVVESILERDRNLKESEIVKIIDFILQKKSEELNSAEGIIDYTENDINTIAETYKSKIIRLIDIIFQKLPITEDKKEILIHLASNIFYKSPNSIGKTGIVIAGFGDEEIFPSLFAFDVYGIINNKLIYRKSQSSVISLEQSAIIVPFAQSEMVASFMEGCDPDYEKTINAFLSKILSDLPTIISDSIYKKNGIKKSKLKEELISEFKKILDNFTKNIDIFKYDSYVEPVVNGVASLPIDELASMAESLVNLTSFKRKVSLNQSETVGGPIDVAVISKGDGFIWVKRKHYFKQEFNNHFFENYYIED